MDEQKHSEKWLYFGLGFILASLLAAVILLYLSSRTVEPPIVPWPPDNGITFPGGTACPEDAKICPDGSAVGRSGPDCEFDPCSDPIGDIPDKSVPLPGQSRMCTMEAKQCPDGSYVGRTGPNCEFAPCPGN